MNMAKTKSKPNKSTPKKINPIKTIWILFGSGFTFIFLLISAISLGWVGFMPSFEELENPKSNLASEVFSADQQLLGKYFIENRHSQENYQSFRRNRACSGIFRRGAHRQNHRQPIQISVREDSG
ncbi:MAG: hypothetical protein LRY51_03530 [Geovibrio sp.]|nr:hypothetical protein [Geovibrio sp.]